MLISDTRHSLFLFSLRLVVITGFSNGDKVEDAEGAVWFLITVSLLFSLETLSL